MKKILSFILILLLLIPSVAFSVVADDDKQDYVTFYFDAPEGFTTDNTVVCIAYGLDYVELNGELTNDGLYKFTLPIFEDGFWLFFRNINDENRYDENGNDRINTSFQQRTVAEWVENGQLFLNSERTEVGTPEGLIYTNTVYYKTNDMVYPNDFYGWGEWLTPAQWHRSEAFNECYKENGGDKSLLLNEDQAYYQWYAYKELYRYGSTSDEAGYYYTLCFGTDADKSEEPVYGVYGNYLLRQKETYSPTVFGYYVYISSEDKCFTLREAIDKNFYGIECVFEEYGLGELIGDVNKDDKLNIKDATYIQKCIAGIEEFAVDDVVFGNCEKRSKEIYSISDFNKDGVRNVKDATSIQKYIAGIDF